jgi:hypothetical protein
LREGTTLLKALKADMQANRAKFEPLFTSFPAGTLDQVVEIVSKMSDKAINDSRSNAGRTIDSGLLVVILAGIFLLGAPIYSYVADANKRAFKSPVSSVMDHIYDSPDDVQKAQLLIRYLDNLKKSGMSIDDLDAIRSNIEYYVASSEDDLTRALYVDAKNGNLEARIALGELTEHRIPDALYYFKQLDPDKAIDNVGGINLNPALMDLQIKRDGNGIPLPIDQQPILQMKIDGFSPIIIDVKPLAPSALPMLLGTSEKDATTDVGSLSPMDKAKEIEVSNI